MPDSDLAAGGDGSLTTPRTILVIFNPVAGWRRRSHLEQVLAHLVAMGLRYTLHETRARGDAERTARTAPIEEFDMVVAAGGDGTINEVINGLAGRNMPLAIIPLGTANVLAAELGLPETVYGQARTIARGPVRPINLGQVNGRRFVMMAGIGFDAHVVANVDTGMKRLVGKLAYVWETLVGFFKYPFRSYRLTIDGREYTAGSAIFANGHYYGGRFVCARNARLVDASLHVCLFKTAGPLAALRYAAWMVLGRLDKLPDYEVVPAGSIVIEGGDGEPVQGDGDIVTTLPLDARISTDRLELVMPG